MKDKVIEKLISDEYYRQNGHLEMIASENWVSADVREALGSVFTNKYAEGYPGHRYYGGCEFVDEVETLAIERAKKLFNCTYANVQPHSGAQANMSVLYALLKPGDIFMGMDLNAGGHLSHGSSVNISGNYYKCIPYGVDSNGFLDYDEIRRIAKESNPKLIICGGSAYPGKIDFEKFREIADEVDAYLMADIAHIAGLVATHLHVSPIPYAHVTTSTTHKTLRGPRGGLILSSAEFAKEHKLNKAVFPGIQGGPHMNTIAAKAVCFKEALSMEYYNYMQDVAVNAEALAYYLYYTFDIPLITGGTDNHLMIIDTTELGMSGKELEDRLASVGIIANKNMIPGDTRKPSETSGVRLGTPAITTRGLTNGDMWQVANAISATIKGDYNYARDIVNELIDRYPL